MEKLVYRILALIFGIIGFVFLVIGGSFLVADHNAQQHYHTADAQITDIESYQGSDGERRHHIWVSYTVEGTAYESLLSYYSSSMRVGQRLEIRYNPEDPYEVQVPESALFGWIFGGVGLLFFLLGMFFVVLLLRRRRRTRQLLASGTEIEGKIVEIQRQANVQINGRHPYLIVCSWYDPQEDKTYLFRSESIRFDPEPILKERDIQTLPVLIDPFDKRKYHVVLDSVLQHVVAL